MKKIYILTAVMAAAALASCTREPVSYDGMSEFAPNTIAFSLESDPDTKAGQVLNTTTINLGKDATGQPMILQETVTWLGSNVQTVPSTKGAPVTDANVAEKYGSFKAIVYELRREDPIGGDEELSSGVDFEYEPKHDKWAHTFARNPFNRFPNMTFWMFMPEVPAPFSPVEADNHVLNLKSEVARVEDVVVKPNILDQKDLLIAGVNLSKADYDPAQGFSAHFFHVFVGVRFKLGALAGNTKIERVTLEGLSGRGSFEFDNRTSMASYGKFIWNPRYEYRDIQNYSFTPEADIVSNSESPVDINNQEGEYTFWLIPQALSVAARPEFEEVATEVYLKLEVSTGNNPTKTIRIKLNDALGGTAENPVKWVAGELHTFTLYPNFVEVKVERDEQNEWVQVTNAGNIPAYLRATVTDTWWANGTIIGPGNGTFNNLGTLSSEAGQGWVYNDADGYYYSDGQVAPGESIPLYTRYSRSSSAPLPGAANRTVSVDVVAQGVADDSVWQ